MVPEAIVDPLEPVEVDEDDAHESGHRPHVPFQRLLEQPPVGQSGGLIMHCRVLQLGAQPQVRYRPPRLPGQRIRQRGGLFIKPSRMVEKRSQHAERLVALVQRSDDHGLYAGLLERATDSRSHGPGLVDPTDLDDCRQVSRLTGERLDVVELGERVGTGDVLEVTGIIQQVDDRLLRREGLGGGVDEDCRELILGVRPGEGDGGSDHELKPVLGALGEGVPALKVVSEPALGGRVEEHHIAPAVHIATGLDEHGMIDAVRTGDEAERRKVGVRQRSGVRRRTHEVGDIPPDQGGRRLPGQRGEPGIRTDDDGGRVDLHEPTRQCVGELAHSDLQLSGSGTAKSA